MTVLPAGPLEPTDPLEVHGMKAGTDANDHGPFRAARTIAKADLADSALLAVADADIATCPQPRPTLVGDVVFATVAADDGGSIELKADVLSPPGDGPFPTVVFVPGGGFVLSPKSGALLRRTAVAQHGFVVISVEYRTLRSGVYSDGVADVATAVSWAKSNAAAYGGDPSRIALWGESAGGYLSSLAVTSKATTEVACVASVFGLTDLSQVAMDFDQSEQQRHLTPEIPEAQYIFGRTSGMTILDDVEAVQRANPVHHVGGHEPPFLLLHGEVDGLVSPGQSQLLHQALLSAGVDSTRIVVEGAGHYGREWWSTTVLDQVAGFLGAHLRAPSGEPV